jgi:hypothetical protein
MPGKRKPSTAVNRGLTGLLGVAVVLLCWSVIPASAAADTVNITRDDSERGDTSLGGDLRRIAITENGRATAIYWEKVTNLQFGQMIQARSDLEVSRCNPTDFPNQASGCNGTDPYGYAPQVDTKLKLAKDNGNNEPDLDTAKLLGTGDPETLTCQQWKHHCVPVNSVSNGITSDDIPANGVSRFVVLVLSARHPDARACSGPANCHVMDLENTAGALSVIKKSSPDVFFADPGTGEENTSVLRVASNDVEKKEYTRVVYSLKLEDLANIDQLLGDQIDVSGLLAVDSSDFGLQTPPLIASRIVFGPTPFSKFDSDPDVEVVDQTNGQNCDANCSYEKVGSVLTISGGDIDDGRRYLNLVAFSSRSNADDNDAVDVRADAGGGLDIKRYRCVDNPDPPPTGCS